MTDGSDIDSRALMYGSTMTRRRGHGSYTHSIIYTPVVGMAALRGGGRKRLA